MDIRFYLLFWSLLLTTIIAAQSSYPTYEQPLSSPLRVTGTFGELRSDHYHAGIDFKAATGTAVYSVGDGFVSRIKIQPGGYGQAIYIDHPEGYRSVYAHLSALSPVLLDTVRAAQRNQKGFALDLRFSPGQFPIVKGEKIGEVGNRGYSFGSHLHFEMRSVQNDAALNPFLFGIKVADTRPPQLRKIKIYEYDDQQQLVRDRAFELLRNKDGSYFLADTVEVMTSKVAMSIKAYDRQNAMPNYNGPYALSIRRDSILTYAIQFDSIPFEETICINAHVDYQEWTANRSWYHRLYSLPGIQHDYLEVKNLNDLPGGKVGQTELVSIEVKDWRGNTSLLTFPLRYVPGNLVAPTPQQSYYQLPWPQKSIIKTDDLTLEFPKGSLYEDLDFVLTSSLDTSSDVVSLVYHLQPELTPLGAPAFLQLSPRLTISPDLSSKVVLARCSQGGSQSSLGGAIDTSGNPISLPVFGFGTYCLMIDDQPPRIEALDRTNRLGNKSRIRFKITDNFDTAGRARGLRYRAELDGQWVLFEYDLKNDIIYHDLERRLPKEGAKLKIVVTDDRGNESVWNGVLRR